MDVYNITFCSPPFDSTISHQNVFDNHFCY
nr:MAG TPA: hypothetical protein [Caudoviricetes sp.]